MPQSLFACWMFSPAAVIPTAKRLGGAGCAVLWALAAAGQTHAQALFESRAIVFANSVNMAQSPVGIAAPTPVAQFVPAQAPVMFPALGSQPAGAVAVAAIPLGLASAQAQTFPAPATTPLPAPIPVAVAAGGAVVFPTPGGQAAAARGGLDPSRPALINLPARATTSTTTIAPGAAAAPVGTQAVAFPAPGESAPVSTAIVLPAPGDTPAVANRRPAEIGDASVTENYANLAARYGSGGASVAEIVAEPLTTAQIQGLDLAAILRRTADTDPRVTGLEFQRQSNDANADALRARWTPRVESSFTTNYTLQDGVTNDALLGVRQRLFDFGQTDAALQTVEAQKILAGARIEGERFTVASEFLTAYLGALTATRGLQADGQEILALEQALDANQRLAQSGAASITTARESQITLNRARARQAERQLNLTQAQQQLRSLSQGADVQPSDGDLNSFIGRFLPSRVDQCLGQAVANAPEISLIEAQIVEAQRQLAQSRVDRLPTIDVVGQTGVRPFGGESDLGLRRNTGINFAISGDLFDGGVSQAELRRRGLEIRELEKERETARRELELDIRRSYSAVDISRQLLTTQRDSLGVLETLVQDRQRQADGGVGLIQDVLAAQIDLEQARNALTDLQADFDRERVRLVLLCGNRF